MDNYYEQFKNQCPKCYKYLAIELIKEDKNWFYWICKFCGFKRKHERSWAIYKHKAGKTFLKRNGWNKFYEVELVRGKKGSIQVVKKQNLLFNL